MNRQHDFVAASRPVTASTYGIKPETEGELLPWSWAVDRINASRGYWICSVATDQRPQLMPIWGVLVDERWFCFGTDVLSKKARNFETNRHVSIAVDDTVEPVILEGVIEAIPTDLIVPYWEQYAAKYDMDAAEMHPGPHFRVVPNKAFGFIDRDPDFPLTATRWLFTA